MADWATINPVLLDVFSQLAADPLPAPAIPFAAQWRDRAQEVMSPDYGHALWLKVTRVVGVGNDEERFDFNPLALDPVSGLMGLETATICGTRKITLQVKSECSENTDTLWCMAILDRIATRLNMNRYWNRLRDEANCAFFDWEDATDHGVPKDGRQLSVATMDMYLYAAVNERDPVPFGWNEKVRLSSQVIPQLDVTNVLIPPG
jgi:hypothetical protein